MKTLLIMTALMVSGCKFGANKAEAKVEEKKAAVVAEAPKEKKKYQYCWCNNVYNGSCSGASPRECFDISEGEFFDTIDNRQHECRLNSHRICVSPRGTANYYKGGG